MARSDDDLRGMLADLETNLVERKESPFTTDRIAQAVCAYANDLPGYGTSGVVFVSATDDGAGLQIARAAAERNGNPPAEFDVDASYIGLALRRTP